MKTTLKKIASLLICLCLIISGMAITASAADTQITFDFGSNGEATHSDGSAITNTSLTSNGYTLTITNHSKCYSGARDAKGNSALKLGASSAAGKFTITAPNDVTSVIFNAAKYKSNTSKIKVNSTAYTLTKNSDDGAYDVITVDTTTNKTVTFETVTGGYRCMIDSIIYVIADTSGGDEGGEEPPVTPDPEEPEVTPDPENGSTLTIAEALALGATKADGVYTTNKYYITGEITEVANTTYGNMTIKDADNNTIYIYGTKNADGTVRYDGLDNKPDAGDVITVLSVVGNFGGSAQLNDAWITAHTDNNPVTPDPEEPGQGGGETPDQPAGNQEAVTNTYLFSNYTEGAQYANETHALDDEVTLSTYLGRCHFTTQLRIYGSTANEVAGYAIISSERKITALSVNAGHKATTVNIYVSEDGSTWNSTDALVTTSTSYKDYTLNIPSGTKYVKFETTDAQIRIASMTVSLAASEPETPPVTPDPEEPPVTPEPEEPKTEIKGTDVEVGSDLTANYVVTVKPEDIEGKTLEMKFTMNGVSDSVECDPAEIVDGTFTFAFEGIGAQCMSDTITASLVSKDSDGVETVHNTVEYSIKSYAQELLNDTKSSDELKTFVSDMLRYGDAAQIYRGHNLDNLATKDVTGLVAAEEKLPTEDDAMSLVKNTENALGNVRFKSATVRFSNINALVIKLNAVTENTKLYVNDKLVELDGATFVTDGVYADKYADTFTFKLYEGDELIQTLVYSINAYTYAMKGSSNTDMASLACALYAYGASASDYAAYLSRS